MGGLGSAVSSMFTPSGTNARRGQEARSKKVAEGYGELWDPALEHAKSEMEWASSLTPQYRQAFQQLARSYNQSGTGLATMANQGLTNAYNQAATQAAFQARAAGLGDAALAGQLHGPSLGLARGMAANTANYTSPQYHQQQLGQLLQLLSAGQQSGPMMNQLASIASSIYGEPAVQVQAGPAELIGKLGAAAISKIR